MIKYVSQEPRFNKQLAAMHKAGGKAAIAAQNAISLLARINTGVKPQSLPKQTKHGELRIKNCVKFDLGNGYRLVCTQKDDVCIVLFVGSHDDCNRWLDNNQGLRPLIDAGSRAIARIQLSKNLPPGSSELASAAEPDYDENLFLTINDRDLRWIFRGLCDAPNERHNPPTRHNREERE